MTSFCFCFTERSLKIMPLFCFRFTGRSQKVTPFCFRFTERSLKTSPPQVSLVAFLFRVYKFAGGFRPEIIADFEKFDKMVTDATECLEND
jgi:hypothetical protein